MNRLIKLYLEEFRNHNFIITGSLALQLQGFLPDRSPTDLDLVTNLPKKGPLFPSNLAKKYNTNCKVYHYESGVNTLQLTIDGIKVDMFYYDENKSYKIVNCLIEEDEVSYELPVMHYYHIMGAKVDIINNIITDTVRSVLGNSSPRIQYDEEFLLKLQKHIIDFNNFKYNKIFHGNFIQYAQFFVDRSINSDNTISKEFLYLFTEYVRNSEYGFSRPIPNNEEHGISYYKSNVVPKNRNRRITDEERDLLQQHKWTTFSDTSNPTKVTYTTRIDPYQSASASSTTVTETPW